MSESVVRGGVDSGFLEPFDRLRVLGMYTGRLRRGIGVAWSVMSCHELYTASTEHGRGHESSRKTQNISFVRRRLRCAVRPRSWPKPCEHMEESASGE